MKVALFNTGARIDDPNYKLRSMRSEALQMYNIESVSYAPTNLDQTFILRHTDGKTYTVVLPCSVPLLSRLAKQIDRGFTRKVIRALETLVFTVRVAWRLPRDKIDVYVILHLWDYEIPFLSLILRIFRPTMIIWFGGSLGWYERLGRLKYCISVSVFRLSLHFASLVLVNLNPEHEYYLFEVLKLPRDKVINFKENIVDDRLFRRLDKEASAKKVGFDRNEINIVMVSRIETLTRIASSRDYEKDPFTALEIFRHLVEKYPKVKLHVFGRGPGMTEFTKRIDKYDLKDKVKIYGYVDQELLPEYYSAADLTFFPATHIIAPWDGQANYESLLCGTPVIYFRRHAKIRMEQPGGFLIDRDPLIGARQILERLNSTYLLKKREEAASIPHDFTIEAFGDHMKKTLGKLA
jgi:glycosyltransferase involved in cell wall biosynthesis